MKIAIDAGHGSNTAGKRTPDGFKEHWINVMCAIYCEQALKRCGFETVRVAWDDMISSDDVDTPLTDRQKLVKNTGCNASVSFHANAYGSGWNSANGVETFYHSNASKAADSLMLAKLVQKRLCEGTKQTNRGVKKDALAMCNAKAMGTTASVLVEIGFMTNKEEAALMKTDAFCKEQAEEVAHGICDYYGKAYFIDLDEGPKVEEVKKSSYLVRITASTLNVRADAGTGFRVTTQVKKGQVYTIVDEKSVGGIMWGKLKSGAGWISLKYATKIQ